MSYYAYYGTNEPEHAPKPFETNRRVVVDIDVLPVVAVDVVVVAADDRAPLL